MIEKPKKSKGKGLSQAINKALSLPKHIDAFVKDHPGLNENDAFVKACLGIKQILSESRVLFNLVFDTVTKLEEEEADDDR